MNSQTRLVLGLVTVFAFYVASNFATAFLVPFVYGIPCSVDFLSTKCAFENDALEPAASYYVLGASLLAVMAALRFLWRDAVVYPFLMLFGCLAIGAVAYDLTMLRPVINGPKITNDTINILGSVIAASFFLLLVILRREQYSILSVARAALGSYTIKVLSVTGFIAVREGVFGATELYLLYVVYAFGAFSLHLMTVCGFIARTASGEKEALA